MNKKFEKLKEKVINSDLSEEKREKVLKSIEEKSEKVGKPIQK